MNKTKKLNISSILFKYIISNVFLTILSVAYIIKPKFIFLNISWGWFTFYMILGAIIFWIIGYIISKKIVDYIISILVSSIATVVCILLGLFFFKNEILLNTAIDFNLLNNLPNSKYLNYSLESDIDFKNDDVNWVGKISFKGVFDGNNHTLYNINKTLSPILISEGGPRNYCDGDKIWGNGIFKENDGEIKNLCIKNCHINIETETTDKLARTGELYRGYGQVYGILVGSNVGVIENVFVINSYINVIGDDKQTYIGTIAGCMAWRFYTKTPLLKNITLITNNYENPISSQEGYCGGLIGTIYGGSIVNAFVYKNNDNDFSKLASIIGYVDIDYYKIENALCKFSSKVINLDSNYGNTGKIINVYNIANENYYEHLPIEFNNWTLINDLYFVPTKDFPLQIFE